MLIRELKKFVNAEKEKMKEIICRVCGKSFVRRSSLRDHVQTDHQTALNSRSFERKKVDNQSKDIQAKSNQCLVKCYMCTSTFNIVSDLERHINRDHEEHKTFECNICRTKIVTTWRLKKHVEMHSNINIKECGYYRSKKQTLSI